MTKGKRAANPWPQTMGGRIGLGRRMLALREGKDITPSELAARLGAPPSTGTRWESDQRVPGRDYFFKLVEVLAVDPIWLQTGEGDPFPWAPELSIALRKIAEEDRRARGG